MKGARILVVDDEEIIRSLVRGILAGEGVDVVEASDGEAGLAEVRRRSPDLILLDLHLPRLDGHGVLSALKSDPKTRLIPVVMLTGSANPSDRLPAIESGADDYVAKPFHPAELVARIRSLVSLKRFTDELEHAANVLEAVAHVVEGRDKHTGDHCRRLGEYGTRVGRRLGLPESELRILRLGGVFHDLGKIAVPDAILNKPGKLTPGEFAVMKEHPGRGFELCRGMRTLERVLPLIRHHHEKLDGSGYPDGLKGEQIPILVRIVSVVDVFDALASKRSYKEPLPMADCFRILREETERGWWDQAVVSALAAELGQGS